MRDERGFTLVEIMVAMVIFGVTVIGALGVMGAGNNGGLFEGFPTGFAAARVARDITAASVYLQAFHEFVASRGPSLTLANGAYDGNYCKGTPCSPEVELPATLSGYPSLPTQAYQVNAPRLDVRITTLRWDATNQKYCEVGASGCAASPSAGAQVQVRTTLTWQWKDVTRTLTVERMIP